jgi:hypothetical protein
MKRQLLILLILTPLLTSLFLLVFPVKCEEFENIDTFNAPVDERWSTSLTTSTETLTVLDGILNYTDIGNVNESSARSRQLSDNDAKIEGRLQTPSTPNIDIVSPIEEQPLFYFKLDEGTGTTVASEIGSFTGTFNTTPVWNSSSWGTKGNYSVKFDSENENDAIFIGNDTAFQFTDGSNDQAFAIEFFVHIEDDPGRLVNKWDNIDNNKREYLTVYSGGVLTFQCRDPSASALIQVATNEISQNTWTHLIFSYNGNATAEGMAIYIDGVLGSSLVYTNTGSYVSMEQTISPLSMCDTDLGGSGQHFKGRVDDFRLWNSSISVSDALTIYTNMFNQTAVLQTIIGLENIETTLDLDTFGVGIIFELQDDISTNPVIVKYGFTTDTKLYSTNFFNLTRSTWYRYEIDYDLFKSQISFKMFTDSGTEITNSDKDILDISTTIHPDILAANTLNVFLGNNFSNDSNFLEGTITWFLDYIKSPFEEFQFEFSSGIETSSTRFTSVNEFGGIAISNGSDFSETSVWSYVIPDYDSITGVMHIATNVSAEADLDDGSMQVIVQVLAFEQDPDDLSITIETLVAFQLAYHLGAPTIKGSNTISFAAGNTFFEKTIGGTGASMESAVDVGFVIYKSSAEKLISQWSTQGETFTHNTQINTTEFPFSNEIAIRFRYNVFHQNTNENIRYTFGIRDFQPSYRDLLGFLPDLPDASDVVGAIANFIVLPLMAGFRLLGAVMAAGTLSMLGPLAKLDTPLSGILSKLDDVYQEIVGDVITYLGDIPAMLTALQGLAAAVAGQIWTAIITEIENILPEVISVLLTIVSTLAELGIALVVWLWDNTVETIYPGAGALLADLVNGIKVLITWVVTGVAFVIQYQFAFFLLLTIFIFIGASERAQNMLEWVLEVADTMAANVVQGLSIIGIAIIIPLGAIWFILMIFWWNA